MTEPSGHPPSRPHPSGASNSSWDVRRLLVAVAALAIIIIGAAAVSVVLSGGAPGVANASLLGPSASGASAVTSPSVGLGSLAPTATASGSPVGGGSAGPSLAATSGLGIRATRIQIVRLGIDLAIVEGDGLDAPIGKAAHYPGMGWPGGGTNIYIYGHARVGMFLRLWDARVGDRVDLLLVDGSKRSYVVDRVLPRVPWDSIQYLQPTQTEELTIQTSTGPTGSDPRFVVIAHPAP